MSFVKWVAVIGVIGFVAGGAALYGAFGAFLPWREDGEAERLAKVLALGPGQRVAEIGAGSGRFSVAFARRGGILGSRLFHRAESRAASRDRRAGGSGRADRTSRSSKARRRQPTFPSPAAMSSSCARCITTSPIPRPLRPASPAPLLPTAPSQSSISSLERCGFMAVHPTVHDDPATAWRGWMQSPSSRQRASRFASISPSGAGRSGLLSSSGAGDWRPPRRA